MSSGTNPITAMDMPDPDVIRVGDTYYRQYRTTPVRYCPRGQAAP